jgi:hypothetical protein
MIQVMRIPMAKTKLAALPKRRARSAIFVRLRLQPSDDA